MSNAESTTTHEGATNIPTAVLQDLALAGAVAADVLKAIDVGEDTSVLEQRLRMVLDESGVIAISTDI